MTCINNRGYLVEYIDGKQISQAHRVWCEHFDKDKVPDGYDIHHINGDKLDNRIQNLQCVKKEIHNRYHAKKNFDEKSEEEKKEIRLFLLESRKEWWDSISEIEKKDRISTLHKDFKKWLDNLSEEEKKEFIFNQRKWWRNLSESEKKERCLKLLESNKEWWNNLSENEMNKWCLNNSKSKNTTGYYRVSKSKNKNYAQGFIWRYRYYEDGKRKSLCSTNIYKLQEKVENQSLPWIKL